jgi:aspartate kinase
MKVSKFGGTSLATAEQVKKVCSILLSDPERQIVVVSAPGKRYKDDIKVTDLLIKCAQARLSGGSAADEIETIVDRYKEIATGLGLGCGIIDTIRNDLNMRINEDISDENQFLDLLKAAGEDNCAKLVAEYLISIGKKAVYVNPREAGLILSMDYGNARALPESYDNLKRLKDLDGIKVFPGFFGYSPEGKVVTFSRGGSDITGAILAAAVQADVYENFTDVDSVYVADPRIIENPKAIHELTYREMRELSYAGFSVLHEEALEPVYRTGIPVHIKNTNNVASPGTRIVTERKITNGPVAGIACEKGFCSINVSKYMMNREIGFGRKVLHMLEDEGISFEHMPSGIDNISILIKEAKFNEQVEERVFNRIRNELHVDDVHTQRSLSVIVVVGEGMAQTVGVAGRATTALARSNVNIEMMNQGASEVSMVFGIKAVDSEKAVRALYNEFFGQA